MGLSKLKPKAKPQTKPEAEPKAEFTPCGKIVCAVSFELFSCL
jgi:hypothetical protein